MESFRRDLLNDMAELRLTLKKNSSASPPFWAQTQNKYSILQNGVLVLLWLFFLMPTYLEKKNFLEKMLELWCTYFHICWRVISVISEGAQGCPPKYFHFRGNYSSLYVSIEYLELIQVQTARVINQRGTINCKWVYNVARTVGNFCGTSIKF